MVEELAIRLQHRHDMDVTVYCRKPYYEEHPPSYRGVKLRHLPAPGGKGVESLAHTFLSILDVMWRCVDVIFVVDPGNSPLILPLLPRRVPIVFHTDGLGWQRKKWSPLQRRYYKWSEKVCARLATWLVFDSRAMQDFYLREYRARGTFIPYGSRVGPPPDVSGLRTYDLTPGGYYLVVTRLEPDNNTDFIIREYRRSGVQRPLVIVGGARYPTPYTDAILAENDDRVRLIGGVYDPTVLNALYANCHAYLHGHEVGGTNPALLRAMYAARACASVDVVFHREVLDDAGVFFALKPGSLAARLLELERDPNRCRELGRRAAERANRLYRWDAVADGYARLFRHLAGRPPRAKRDPGEVYLPESFWRSSPEDPVV